MNVPVVSSMRRRSRHALGYLFIPLMGVVSPLIALPAITSRQGAAAWAALAIGQSIGMAAATVGELGWSLNGPQRVSRMSAANAYQTVALSLQSKLLVVLTLLPVVGYAAHLLSPDFKIEAGVIAIASLASSMNTVWFFLGKSQPWIAVAVDGLPRLFGVLIGALMVLFGAPLLTYAVVGLVLPSLISPAIGLYVARSRAKSGIVHYRLRHVLIAVRAQSHAFTARLVGAMYIALPVTLVSIVSPGGVATFAAGDRLMRLVLGGLNAVPTSMQGWVGSAVGKRDRWARAERAVLINFVLGTVVALCFGFGAPLASALMFSGTATISQGMAWVFALVIVIVSTSRATGNLALVALSKIKVILWSALAGAAVGVPAILGLAALLGPVGGALGELAAEAVVLGVQVFGIRHFQRGAVRQDTAREKLPPRILYVAVHDMRYPRNVRIRAFLEQEIGAEVDVVMLSERRGFVRHWWDLLVQGLAAPHKRYDFVILAEMSLPFASASLLLSWRYRAVHIVDFFIGMYETQIEDQRLGSPRSPRALVLKVVERFARASSALVLADTEIRACKWRTKRTPALNLPVGAPPWACASEDLADQVSEPVRVLYYGNYIPLHGVSAMLHGLAQSRGQADVTLTMIGDGEQRQLAESLVEELALSDVVRFRPAVGEESLASLIHAHDIVLGIFGESPKAQSVIANKVWQGLACGRVVVTRENLAITEIRGIVGGQLSLAADGDPSSIAEAILAGSNRAHHAYADSAAHLEAYVRRSFDVFGEWLILARRERQSWRRS